MNGDESARVNSRVTLGRIHIFIAIDRTDSTIERNMHFKPGFCEALLRRHRSIDIDDRCGSTSVACGQCQADAASWRADHAPKRDP